MLTQKENSELILRLRTELIPNLSEVRSVWEVNHDSNEDPESHIEPYMELLTSLAKEFAQDPELVKKIDREKLRTKEWITEATENMNSQESMESEAPDDDYYRRSDLRVAERDIFDDVDV